MLINTYKGLNTVTGNVLAIGDCNTLGVAGYIGNSYPERFGRASGMDIRNRGYTMATTREGFEILKENITGDVTHLFVQFGLADSYKTFKYSPYVLYYPDNFLRKQVRSLVKKYKKICRNSGLSKRFGEVNVVGPSEYEGNLQQIIALADTAKVFLIDTVPHKQVERNIEILKYNSILSKVARQHTRCVKIDLYAHFLENLDHFYHDETHCNGAGYDHIANQIMYHFPV
jgi:hypothetical protein